jgi:hypothetical protein
MNNFTLLPLLLLLASCLGAGGSSPNSSSSNSSSNPASSVLPSNPIIASQVSPATNSGFTIQGQLIGASSALPVLLTCIRDTALINSLGCSIPNEGLILDSVVMTDASGNYIFSDVATTAHPNSRIPIPAGFIYTVSPSLWLFPAYNYAPQPYSFTPTEVTFGITLNNISGLDFNKI